MTTQTRKKHLGLWWLVLVLGLTNVAIFLEANQQTFSEPVAVAASVEEATPKSGSVAGHVASISVTIGSGLIILGASIIWVSRFVKDLAATKPQAKTRTASNQPTKTATKSTTKAASSAKTTKTASKSTRKSSSKPATPKTTNTRSAKSKR